MFHGGGWWRYIAYDETKGKPSVDRMLLLRVLGYAKPYGRLVGVVLITIIISAIIDLIPPLLFRDLIDTVIPNADIVRLNWLAAGMIGIPILSELIGVLQRWTSAKAGKASFSI